MKSSKEIEKKYSKTFCVYPWVHQMINQHGDFQLCCSANTEVISSNGEDFNVRSTSMKEVWNSQGMKEIRRKMLSGEQIKNCEHCYYLESIGFQSWREEANLGWFKWHNTSGSLEKIIDDSIANDLEVKNEIQFLDIRFGSKCNLSCRMCEPKSSHKLLEDFKKVEELNISKTKKLSDWLLTDKKDQDNIMSPWLDNENLWSDIQNSVPKLKRVYLAGGEPFITAQNERLIDDIIASGRAHEIMLQINTNATVFTQKLCEKLKNFGQVILMLSVDGVGKTQEYIRYPSRWSHIEKNLYSYVDFMKNNQNVSVYLCIVTQMLNVFNFKELLQFSEKLLENTSEDQKRRFTINPIPLSMPSHYRVESLPAHMKDSAKIYLEECLKIEILKYFPSFKSLIESLLNNSLNAPVNQEDIDFFVEYNSLLDRTRSIHLKDFLPSFYKEFTSKLKYPEN